ncbi:MAG: delta-60 repeat domain-containing protein [Candidatus Udaeobacter sp.]
MLLALTGAQQIAWGAAGDLDQTFGTGGHVFTDFSGNSDYGHAIALQPDGRIIVAGQSGVYPVFHAALARYNSNGQLDPTFGTGGKVIAALDAGGDGLSAIALQPDGKVVAAGSVIHDNWELAFLLARFNPNGTLDTTFGNQGVVVTNFGDSTAAGNALVFQPDGKIVVAGVSGAGPYSELNDFALARYNSNGSLDQIFGNGGKVKTHFPGVYNTGSRATAAALQADGRLVVSGTYKNEATARAFAVARYNANGSLDTTFGSGGMVTTSMGSGDAIAFSVALLSGGRIVAAGYVEAGHRNHDFALACYNTSGTLDQSFGSGGRVTTDFFGATDDIAYGLAAQPDGKLVLAGRTGAYPAFHFALARYQNNGQLDQTFGTGGKVSSMFDNSGQAYGVAVQRDGKIVLAGISAPAGSFDFTVARYIGNLWSSHFPGAQGR